MTTAEPNTIVKNGTVILPLHNLVVKLRQHGFVIRPDDYIEILKVVETFGARAEDLDAALLCPLIATSPEEQERFYKLFAEYRHEQSTALPESKDLKEKWLKKVWRFWRDDKTWILALVGVMLALVVYRLLVRQPEKPTLDLLKGIDIAAGTDDNRFRVGDTVSFNAQNFLSQPVKDSTVAYFWDTGDGFKKGNESSPTVQLSQEGEKTVRLKIRAANYAVQDSILPISIAVCPAAPRPTFSGLQTDYALNDELQIQPSGNGQFHHAYWKVNDSLVKPDTGLSLRYRFAKPGSYSIEFFGFLTAADSESSPCIYRKKFDNITIADDRYSLVATPVGKPLQQASHVNLNPLLYFLLLPAVLIGLGTFFWWRKKKNKAHEKGEKADSKTYNGRKPPYETPFENKDVKLVEPESGFRQVYQSFRQKAEDELTAFNVPASIRQTIRTGGLPALVFTNRMRYTDYVVLIDRSLAKSMQVRLFELLVNRLHEEEITVERFFYTGKFENISHESKPDSLSFKRFAELYKMHTLIVLGSGRQLVYEAYPVLDKQLSETLQEWEYKAILTPVAYKDWGDKETLVAAKFILLPADLEGQLILLQAIREKSLNHKKYLSSIAAFYETEGFDFGAAEDVKTYLHDEVLFQWLCAAAVYHKLRWEVLVEVGKAVCTAYHQPEKMNFTNLLRLCRIQWVADGAFPAGVRLELLKALTPENEVLARETLLQMLRYAETYFGDDHFFQEEKEVQKITSRFLLFTHDPEHYADFAGAQPQFKALYDSGKLWDTPQKVYLENPGGRWTTLVQRQGRTKGLNDYFNVKKLEALMAGRKILWRNAAIAASFVVLLAGLFLFKNNLPPNSFLVKSSPLYQSIFIRVGSDSACGGTNQRLSYQGALQVGTANNYPLFFNEQGLASASLPSTAFGQEAYLMISTGDNRNFPASSFVRLSSDSIHAVLSTCNRKAAYAVNIVYNDSSKQAAVASLAEFLKQQGYTVQHTTVETFDTATAVYYFAEGERKGADTLLKLLSYQFNDLFAKARTVRDTTWQGAGEKVLGIAINFGANTEIATRLDDRCTEIWRGQTGNRLITINPPMLYYSTGDKRTYGTYRISQVWKSADGTFRVICNAGNQFALFFLRNVRSNGFSLSVCQQRYNSAAEAKAVAVANCDPFNPMSLYYEQNANRIYVPLNVSKPLEAANQAKLKKVFNQFQDLNDQYGGNTAVSAKYYYNPLFKRDIPASLSPNIQESVAITAYTPFDRSYGQYDFSKETPERKLSQIDFDQKYSLTASSQQLLSQMLAYLKNNPAASARVVIRSFYTRDDNIRTKGEYASLESFLRSKNYNSNQWKIEVGEPQNETNQVQQKADDSGTGDRFAADVYGKNFPDNFPPSRMSKAG